MQVRYYVKDLVFSFPCRVLDFISKSFLLHFLCGTGTNGEQKCRLLERSAAYLVIQNLCALHTTFASSKQMPGALWSCKLT